MQLFDTHAHLDQAEFNDDRAEVVARARAAGVENIITVGISADTSAAAIEIAAKFPGIYAAVGLQPNYLAEALPGDWDRVVAMLDQPGVVAIGETGLDRHWDFTPFALQQDYFDRHLRLSQERDLPFIVHIRDCDADILAMLREAHARGPLRGVMHSFTGSRATGGRVPRDGPLHQFRRHGDLQKVSRPASNCRNGSGGSNPHRNR